MKQGSEHPALAHLLLVESYVLDFALHPGRLVFSVDFALGPAHPEYRGPIAGDAYDFRRGLLIFGGLGECHWMSANGMPSRDPDGTMDWDSFYSITWDASTWRIEGDFGTLRFLASTVDVQLDADPRSSSDNRV